MPPLGPASPDVAVPDGYARTVRKKQRSLKTNRSKPVTSKPGPAPAPAREARPAPPPKKAPVKAPATPKPKKPADKPFFDDKL